MLGQQKGVNLKFKSQEPKPLDLTLQKFNALTTPGSMVLDP
jgi:DNA modification methylase